MDGMVMVYRPQIAMCSCQYGLDLLGAFTRRDMTDLGDVGPPSLNGGTGYMSLYP